LEIKLAAYSGCGCLSSSHYIEDFPRVGSGDRDCVRCRLHGCYDLFLHKAEMLRTIGSELCIHPDVGSDIHHPTEHRSLI